MNLGIAIQRVRKHRKIKQQDLAKKIGISQVCMSYIETGKTRPQLANLKKIASVLNVPIPLLYILATKAADVPKHLREKFKAEWPALEKQAAQILFDDPENMK